MTFYLQFRKIGIYNKKKPYALTKHLLHGVNPKNLHKRFYFHQMKVFRMRKSHPRRGLQIRDDGGEEIRTD